MLYKFPKLISCSDGQAIVEFALVAVPLFLVLFGICEFGYAWMQNNTATSAAREGARVAAVVSQDQIAATATARALAVLAAGNINPSSATVNTLFDPATRRITVTVSFPYNAITGGLIPVVNDITLQGETVMRWEQ